MTVFVYHKDNLDKINRQTRKRAWDLPTAQELIPGFFFIFQNGKVGYKESEFGNGETLNNNNTKVWCLAKRKHLKNKISIICVNIVLCQSQWE